MQLILPDVLNWLFRVDSLLPAWFSFNCPPLPILHSLPTLTWLGTGLDLFWLAMRCLILPVAKKTDIGRASRYYPILILFVHLAEQDCYSNGLPALISSYRFDTIGNFLLLLKAAFPEWTHYWMSKPHQHKALAVSEVSWLWKFGIIRDHLAAFPFW